MSRGFSLYLDAVRFLAALLVVLSHLAYARFTGGAYQFLRDWNLGSDAVVLFFVLSGLVIAYTADTKDRALGRFAFNRLTRVWSVAIPAVLLTIGFDALGSTLNPAAYDGWWYAPHSTIALLFEGLSFATDWGVSSFRLGSNGPYWSLSYEVAYYALFAAVVYLQGWRRVLALAVMLPLFGVKPLLLLPCWLMGGMVYRRLRDGAAIERGRAWLLTLAPPAIYVGCLYIGVPKILLALTQALLGQQAVEAFLGFSNEFLWNNFIGLLVAAHFLGIAMLVRQSRPATWPRPAQTIRWLAGGSFSLYLLHYPVLQLAGALLSEEMMPVLRHGMMPVLRHGLLLAVTLAVCFGVAELFERRLARFRCLALRVVAYLQRRKVGVSVGVSLTLPARVSENGRQPSPMR